VNMRYNQQDTEFLDRMMLQGFSYYEAEQLLKNIVKREEAVEKLEDSE
jgi:hypothetical protein